VTHKKNLRLSNKKKLKIMKRNANKTSTRLKKIYNRKKTTKKTNREKKLKPNKKRKN